MNVLELIRTNPNWEAYLEQEPYFIKTTWDGDYAILKYNQLVSDFNEQIVRECRGTIFYIPHRDHSWAYPVCVPFYKFGNYGEGYAPQIDWSTARVREKVDGSLIKVWYHHDEWHVSTNGTIDARKAPTSIEGISFYDVFMRALEKNGDPRDFFLSLDINYTYMFELVSPETRVTIAYPEPAIYYLGARSLGTLLEEDYPTRTKDHLFFPFVKLPRVYLLDSLERCIEAANAMGADEEGFVVCDSQFRRIKVKSPEYLIASHVRNNGALTVKRIIEAMRAGYIDDLYAYAPDYRDFIDSVVDLYHDIALELELSYARAQNEEANTDFPWWGIVTHFPTKYHDYLFQRHYGQAKDALSYLDNMRLNALADWIKEEIKDC